LRSPRSLRVLIVDDERDTVHTLSAILRDEGHDTKGVYAGKDVLAAIREFDPDVAVVDISMPGMTGWDVAREVRAEFPGERPMLIAISGHYTQGADRILTQMSGFKYFLAKPCDPNVLTTLLGTA
jgi:DNA-binding response OmpR family regulator